MYNAEFEMLLKTQHITAGGAKPLAIHFALDKPFDVGPDDVRWEYLCYRPKMVNLLCCKTHFCSCICNERRQRFLFLSGFNYVRRKVTGGVQLFTLQEMASISKGWDGVLEHWKRMGVGCSVVDFA